MESRRRFIFRGNAATISGRIVRPTDVVIESPASSSLTVAGGRSVARSGAQTFGDFVRLGSASTSAEGLFDDLKGEIELTYARVSEDTLRTTTRVVSEVLDLAVGKKPQVTVKRLRAALASRSPDGSNETPSSVSQDTTIDGVAIGGYALIVELDTAVFDRYDTRSKLLAAADDPKFVRKSGHCLFMKKEKDASPAALRVVQGGGTTYATIVKSIRWAKGAYPGARIDGNLVVVPDFGSIFFGELLIGESSRRLTMLRFELGSPTGGFFACGEVDSNGTWSN